MEEDIKILEEFINYKNINNKPYQLIAVSHEALCEAIQNLIKQNKELEMQNKELLLRLKADGLIERDKYWINKIKEKIEELEAISISKDIYYDDIKRLLQELLEES